MKPFLIVVVQQLTRFRLTQRSRCPSVGYFIHVTTALKVLNENMDTTRNRT